MKPKVQGLYDQDVEQVANLSLKRSPELPAYAWPGGYPMVYLDLDCNTYCATCATEALVANFDIYGRPVDYFVHYEGPPVFCQDCNVETESAYGDPEDEHDTPSC